MVSQIDQQNSSITPAIVLQSNNNNTHCSNTNNNNNNNNNINNSMNTTISINSSSISLLEDDPIEEFETDNEFHMDDTMPRSSSFSVADTESDIESDADTEITLDESEDCPLSPAPSRANTNGVITINSSIFQSVISQLKDHEKLNSKLPTLPEELKYTIVLDIDETLLHSFFPEKVTPAQYQYVRRLAQAEAQRQANGEITFEQREFHEVDVGDGTIVVAHLRPHMWDFLRSLFRHFDVAVWSAGGRLYVDNMCKLLFPAGTPQPIFSLCWDDCHLEQTPQTAHYVYTKPMHCLTSRFPSLALSHLILIDNRKENGYHYPHQIVHCPDFFELPWLNALKSKNELICDQFLKEECLKQIHNVIQNLKYIYNKQEENKEDEEYNDKYCMEDENNWEAFSPNPIHNNNNNSQSQHLSTDYDLLALMKELQNEQVQSRSISRSFSNSSSSAFFSSSA